MSCSLDIFLSAWFIQILQRLKNKVHCLREYKFTLFVGFLTGLFSRETYPNRLRTEWKFPEIEASENM